MAILGGDGSIILTTKIDQSGLNKGMASLKGAITKLGAAIGVTFGVRALVQFGKQAVQLASDLQEVQNVVDTAFGSMSYKIEQFSKTAIENFGISELTAKRTASTYMAMAKGMGIAEDVASDMAITMTGLTADIASFYNMSQERADVILKSVYTGETETLKQLGIVMTEVNLQNFAMSQGITKNISKMTQQEKTMLRYQFVLQQTALAQGDFAKTSDSWANQTRILAERWKEMQQVWGQAFMQLGTLVLPTINKTIDGLTRIGEQAQIAAQWIYKAFTGKTLEVTAANNQANAIDGATESQKELNDAIADTEKAQKGVLAGFDELQILSSQSSENMSIDSSLGNGENLSNQLETIKESESTLDFSKFEDFLERLEAIAVLVETIGTSLLAWKITDLLLTNSDKFWGQLVKISGQLAIVAGAILTVYGYSDAWVNGIDWSNLATTMSGIVLLIGGIALAISPMAAAFASVGAGISLIILGFQDIINNGASVQNVLTIISGIIIAIIGSLTAMGKLGVFTTLLPVLGTLAGAFLAVKGATDAWVYGVDWQNFTLLLSGVALAITSIAVSSDPLYAGIAMIAGGITMFVVGLRDLINNGANAKNTILMLTGAITTAIGVLITISQVLETSLSPTVYFAVAGFTALAVGIGAVISQWDNMSTAERVISVLGLLAVAASSAAIAFGSLQSAWSLGIAAATIIAGIVAITAAVESASDRANLALSGVEGASAGNYAMDFTQNLPHLATGAVIPPNREFLAVLGDQKKGTNIEAPLDTIKQAVAEVYSGSTDNININFSGSLSQLARVLNPQITRENRRVGTSLITSGG